MRLSAILLSCGVLPWILVAAWSKEGEHIPPTCTDFILIRLDHEIFRLRDEIMVAEGVDVTFYGTL